jgi:hypothetical protein
MNASNLIRTALLLSVACLATGCYDFHYDADRAVYVDNATGETRDSLEDAPMEPRCVSLERTISDRACARTLCAPEYTETGRCELLPEVEVEGELTAEDEVVSEKAAAKPGACAEGWSEYIFEHTSSRKICDPELMGVSRPNTDSDGYECMRRGEYCCAHWCVRDAQ